MTELQSWFDAHERDYQAVLARLHEHRTTLLEGSISDAADMLKKSYDNAVLSIKTEKDRHERAFTALYAGDLTRKEAALETVYGGNKKNWMARTHNTVDWRNVALAVRAHAREGRWNDLLDAVVDNLVGVSYRKASFMLAMVGLYEYACVDSNVAQFAGLEESEGSALEFDDAADYMATCNEIFTELPVDAPLFVIQWAVYDYQRGEHARHMAFYREL